MSFTFLQVTQHILQFLLNWPTFLELLHFGLFFQGQSLEDAISVVLFYRPYPDAKPVLWVFACFSWLGSIYLSRLVFVYTSTYLYILFIVGCCEFGCQQQCSWVKHQMLCGGLRVLRPWFIWWFLHCICCSHVYIVCFSTYPFSSPFSLLLFSFENRPTPFPGQRS